MNKAKLQPWQFSLRHLFAFVTACAVVFALVGHRLQRARRHQAAVEAITELGGYVYYHKPLPRSYRIDGLAYVKQVGFSQSTRKQVTDKDLIHLAEMTDMHYLWLDHTSITDEGLKHLTGLTKLKELSVCLTKVTPEGIVKLQEALPNCAIWWKGSELCDLRLFWRKWQENFRGRHGPHDYEEPPGAVPGTGPGQRLPSCCYPREEE